MIGSWSSFRDITISYGTMAGRKIASFFDRETREANQLFLWGDLTASQFTDYRKVPTGGLSTLRTCVSCVLCARRITEPTAAGLLDVFLGDQSKDQPWLQVLKPTTEAMLQKMSAPDIWQLKRIVAWRFSTPRVAHPT